MKFIKKIFNNLKKQSNLSLTIVLMLAIVVVLNFISYQIFARFDLTQNKDYSISQISKKTVSDLDDLVNVKVYFSQNLPPSFRNLEQEIKDILNEYEAYSNGDLEVDFIDPSSFEDPVNKLSQIGIKPLQFNVTRNDSYEVARGFMGMIIQYGDEQEVMPVVESSKNLEYKITTAIKKLTTDKMMTVGILDSHGAVDAGNKARNFYKSLEDLYKVIPIDLKIKEDEEKKKKSNSLENIDTLVMFGPKEEFSEEELKAIDNFVMSKRPVIALVDGVVVDPRSGVSKNKTGLNKLFSEYGLEIQNNLISDTSNAVVSMPTGLFNVSIEYALWPKITKKNFDQENVVVSSLESLVLPWVSSINIKQDKIKEDTEVSILAKSTPDACAQTSSFNINPQNNSTNCQDTKQYNLAVSLAGNISSAFSEEETEAKILVVGDSDFATDQFYSQNSDNITFLQNMIDSVTLDEDLISIRSQGITERPIKDLDKGSKGFIRYANIFGMTILVLAFGLLRYYLRRKNS